MSTIHDLTKFMLARIGEDKAVANSAIQAERPGTHWRWFDDETDEPARLDGEYEGSVSLRTVEQFPSRSVGMLPAFIVTNAEVGKPEQAGAFRHVARHDPARVLAECEAQETIVGYLNIYHATGDLDTPIGRALLEVGKIMATVWADHPDYDPAWRP